MHEGRGLTLNRFGFLVLKLLDLVKVQLRYAANRRSTRIGTIVDTVIAVGVLVDVGRLAHLHLRFTVLAILVTLPRNAELPSCKSGLSDHWLVLVLVEGIFRSA